MFGLSDDADDVRAILKRERAYAIEQEETIAKLREQLTAHERGVALFNGQRAAWKAERDRLADATNAAEAKAEAMQATAVTASAVAERALAQLATQQLTVDAARKLCRFVKPAPIGTLHHELQQAVRKLDEEQPS